MSMIRNMVKGEATHHEDFESAREKKRGKYQQHISETFMRFQRDVITATNHNHRRQLGRHDQHSHAARSRRLRQDASHTGTLSVWCLSKATTAAKEGSTVPYKTSPKVSKNSMTPTQHCRMLFAGIFQTLRLVSKQRHYGDPTTRWRRDVAEDIVTLRRRGIRSDISSWSLPNYQRHLCVQHLRSITTTSRYPVYVTVDHDGEVSVGSQQEPGDALTYPRELLRYVSGTSAGHLDDDIISTSKNLRWNDDNASTHRYLNGSQATLQRHLRGISVGSVSATPQQHRNISEDTPAATSREDFRVFCTNAQTTRSLSQPASPLAPRRYFSPQLHNRVSSFHPDSISMALRRSKLSIQQQSIIHHPPPSVLTVETRSRTLSVPHLQRTL